MNGLILAGLITTIASIIVLMFLSIWIGIIAIIVGIGLILGGLFKSKKGGE